MLFPSSNLATAVQPWGRAVEKGINNLETLTATERVNNAARDAQAALSIKRLDASVASVAAATAAAQVAADLAQDAADDAAAAIAALGQLDEATSTYKINAANLTVGTLSGDRISGGTITGTIIQSASTGQRVIVNASNLTFYSSNNAYSGSMYGSSIIPGSVIMESPDAGTFLAIYNNGTTLASNSSAEFRISAGSSYIKGNTVRLNGTVELNGSASALSAFSVSGYLYNYGATSVGSTANVRLGADYRFYTISSSRRYKTDIQDIDYGLKALQLRPRTWIDKVAYEENGNSTEGLTRIPGFIAEELDEIGLGQLVEYKDGIPESISYDRIVGAIIPVIQYQDSVIKELTARIEALENK